LLRLLVARKPGLNGPQRVLIRNPARLKARGCRQVAVLTAEVTLRQAGGNAALRVTVANLLRGKTLLILVAQQRLPQRLQLVSCLRRTNAARPSLSLRRLSLCRLQGLRAHGAESARQSLLGLLAALLLVGRCKGLYGLLSGRCACCNIACRARHLRLKCCCLLLSLVGNALNLPLTGLSLLLRCRPSLQTHTQPSTRKAKARKIGPANVAQPANA
jgi:hypothetical protein